jgi:phosphoribosylanthranilate isomerase
LEIIIYTITTLEQGETCAKLGVDTIGIYPCNEKFKPWQIDVSKAKKITESLKDKIKVTVITHLSDTKEILELAKEIRPNHVQLICPYEDISLETLISLRNKLNKIDIKLIFAVGVSGPESIDEAKELAKAVDMIILDTRREPKKDHDISMKKWALGATGKVNDWNIGAKIVEEVNIPVILAGGLGPDNVKEAIEKVKPFGVDSMTKTDVAGSNHLEKDFGKIKNFVEEAKKVLR